MLFLVFMLFCASKIAVAANDYEDRLEKEWKEHMKDFAPNDYLTL